MISELPFVDEHGLRVDAAVSDVWRSLDRRLGSAALRLPRLLIRLLAAEPPRASGASLAEGSALPGFKVEAAVPGQWAVLMGRHRFSRYALVLSVAGEPGGTLLSARTHAQFPGWRGRAYRQLVIGSGAHRLLTRRLLRAIRRDAERRKAR